MTLSTPTGRMDARDLKPYQRTPDRPVHGLSVTKCADCGRGKVVTTWNLLCASCSDAQRPVVVERPMPSRLALIMLDPAEGFCS